MVKNIVICCDRDGNQSGAQNSNAVRLHSVLQNAPASRLACHHSGIRRAIAMAGILLALCWFPAPPAKAAVRQSPAGPQTSRKQQPPPKPATPAAAAAKPKPPAAPAGAGQAFIYQNIITDVSYAADGTGRMDKNVRVRVQSQAAVKKLGLLSFYYAADYDTVEIESIEVHHPDGTVVKTLTDDVHDLPAPVTRAAPLFSDFRMKQVTVRGLTLDSVLAYRVRFVFRKPVVPRQFWFAYDFTREAVTLDEELRIRVPKSRNVIVKSHGVQPSVSTQGKQLVYFWKTNNLKVEKPAEGRKPPPAVLLTTFHTWDQVGRWWASLARRAAAPTPAVRAKEAEITRGAATDRDKLRAIYHYVSTQFRYISVSFGIGHYQPHAAGAVLQNGFGDCKDKATLLLSLLDAAGIPAYPALVNSSRRIDPDVPSPGQFDHVINVVPLPGKPLWLDTTTEVAPLGLLARLLRGDLALVMPAKQPAYLERTPPDPPFASFQHVVVDAKLDPKGILTAKISVKSRGDAELLFRILFRNVEQAKWQKLVQQMSYIMGYSGTVSDVVSAPTDDLSTPFSFSYDYRKESYSDWSDQQIVMPLPTFSLPDPGKPGKKPSQPVILGTVGEELDFRSTVQLPPGYQPKLPKPIQIKTSFATYQSTCSLVKGALFCDRTIDILTDKLPPASLDKYRQFRKSVEDDHQSYVSLTTPGSARSAQEEKARDLFDRGRDALKDRSHSQALDLFQQALKLDPKLPGAWMGVSEAYAGMQELDEAMTAIKKEIAGHPKEAVAYQYAGWLSVWLQRYDDAIAYWRKDVELEPKNGSMHAYLAAMLATQGRYGDAAAEYSAAASLDPRDPRYPMELGRMYLRAGQVAKALPAFAQAAKLNPSPDRWNTIAYLLAVADRELPEAHRYSEMAVAAQEQASAGLSLDKLRTADLQAVTELAADWDTLGWVDFQQGNLAGAGRYLRASWALSHDPTVGYHLGRLEEKLGRKRAAIRIYALARATARDSSRYVNPGPMGPGPGAVFDSDAGVRQELKTKLSELLPDADRVEDAVRRAVPRLMAERTAKLPQLVPGNATAEFFLLLTSPDGAVSAVRFVKGDHALAGLTKAVARARFSQPFPDHRPTRIVRRGVLSCSPVLHDCELVLYPPSAVKSIY